MGVNNRQRRAAKQRKRTLRRSSGNPQDSTPRPSSGAPGNPFEHRSESDIAALVVAREVMDVTSDPTRAPALARELFAEANPDLLELCRTALDAMSERLVASAVVRGWSSGDLAQLVRRQLSARHVPHVLALLAARTESTPAGKVSAEWSADLAAAGRPAAADLDLVEGYATALGVAGLLDTLPTLPPVIPVLGQTAAPSSARQAPPGDEKALARVRALLAKAESTEFDEEAEALSAKAQELIARHALEGLLAQTEEQRVAVGALRIWIDAPYVMPKAGLIQAVATANRCRAVVVERFAFSTVVGASGDLRAVELLVTSLLVQASTAMLRHGRQADRYGRSLTRSFRSAFLEGYAHRIGDRLEQATEHAVSESGHSGELVPVLARHTEAVDDAFNAMFPHLVSKHGRTNLNGHGWAAGMAAADQALLDYRLQMK